MAEDGKIGQAKTEWWREFISQVRWFWVYGLPNILAAPFHFRPFMIIYFGLLGILILAFLISVPFFWADLFGALLRDTLAKIGAENSVEMAYQFITSLSAGWLLLIWLAYGALARIWGEPRRKFLHEIEDTAHLTLLRGGGDRISFITRMNLALNSGLGLGPTGKLLTDYLPRSEDEAIRKKAGEIYLAQQPKGVLISAPPASGKTRSAMELITHLDPAMVIVWRRGYSLETHPALPVWKGKLAILADNLEFGASVGEAALPLFLNYLAQRCPRALIVATARQERTPSDMRELAVFHLQEVPLQALLPLAQAVARHESELLEKKRSSREDFETLRRPPWQPGGGFRGDARAL